MEPDLFSQPWSSMMRELLEEAVKVQCIQYYIFFCKFQLFVFAVEGNWSGYSIPHRTNRGWKRCKWQDHPTPPHEVGQVSGRRHHDRRH